MQRWGAFAAAAVTVAVMCLAYALISSSNSPRKVRVQTSEGTLISVSTDGMLRLSNKTMAPETFVLMPLTPQLVGLLLQREDEVALHVTESGAPKRTLVTKSGCKCSGVSNSYGFGAYCNSWEESFQLPWCYVNDECPSASKRGSFGMKHERCRTESDDYPTDSMPLDGDPYGTPYGTGQAAEVWKPPEGCRCSGYTNKHGYGAYCKAWEETLAPGQIPWCYTFPNCTVSAKKKGSFGQSHVECSPFYLHPPPVASPPPPSPPPPPPPPPPSPPPPPKLKRFQKQRLKTKKQEDDATALASKAAKHSRYFALVSSTTGGFVTASPPPHRNAMHVVSREASLSARAVFATLPSGHVFSVGTRSVLGVCAEAGTSGPVLCVGYRERRSEPHLKFIRSVALKSALKLSFVRA